MSLDERDDFVADVAVELRLHVTAVRRMRGAVVERLLIGASHREQLDSPGIDEVAESGNHALLFHLVFVAPAGRESDQWRAPVTKHQNSHLAIEMGGMPPVILAVHDKRCGPSLAGSMRAQRLWDEAPPADDMALTTR